MKAERRQSEVPSGGKWEFSSRNTNIEPTYETFEVAPVIPLPHLRLRDAIVDNYLASKQWKPKAILQRGPWGDEGDSPSLFFVFENSLKTALTEKVPDFSSVINDHALNPKMIKDRSILLPNAKPIQRALDGTNMYCTAVWVEFNQIHIGKRGFLKRERDGYQNGVVFFELLFWPVDEIIKDLQGRAREKLKESKGFADASEELIRAKVIAPQLLFVAPSEA